MDLRNKFVGKQTNIKKLSESLQLTFLKRLYELLQNGYSLLASLEALTYEKRFVPYVELIVKELRKGLAIDEAFHRANFHQSITSYLYFVRLSGDLDENILRCIGILEQRITYKEKLMNIVRYPLFLLCIFILLLFSVKHYILPAFEQLFQSENNSYHSIQQALLLFNVIIYSIPVLFTIITVVFLLWHFLKRKLTMEQQLKLLRKIPFYHMMKKMQISYIFAMHFSMYLQAGLSFRQVLVHLETQNKLPIIAFYGELLLHQLNNGLPIGNMLKHLPFLDSQIAYAFMKENETAISNELHGYAIFIADKLHHYVMRTLNIIQPLFFGIIAGFIVFVYMTLLYPMFEFMQNI